MFNHWIFREKNDEKNKVDFPFKLAKKSINIKRNSKLPSKIDLIKSPAIGKKFVSSTPSKTLLSSASQVAKKPLPTKIPSVLNFTNSKLTKAEILTNRNDEFKENVKRILQEKKKKKEPEETVRKKSLTPKSNMKSSPGTLTNKSRALKDKTSEKLNQSDISSKNYLLHFFKWFFF